MPAGETYNQYYDMYCGDTFNYLWYNIYDMDVAKNVKMSIRAPKTVLSIGPDFGEATYECKNSSNSIISDSIPSGYTKDSGPYTRSNTINGASGAEFWIRPYWNDSSYSLSVKCDFKVNYSGESYNIKKGDKCYLVHNGYVMGWMEITGMEEKKFVCNTTGKEWNGKFILRSGPFHYLDNKIKMKGFQGFRYFSIDDYQ